MRAKDSINITSSHHGAFPSPSSSAEPIEDTLLESIGKMQSNDRVRERTGKLVPKSPRHRTSAALLSNYKSFLEKEVIDKVQHDHFLDKSERLTFKKVVNLSIREKKWHTRARRVFESLDVNGDGKLTLEEFVEGISALGCDKTNDELSNLFLRL